jgi:hypothetical protein
LAKFWPQQKLALFCQSEGLLGKAAGFKGEFFSAALGGNWGKKGKKKLGKRGKKNNFFGSFGQPQKKPKS